VRAAAEIPNCRVSGAIASEASAALGKDAGELAGVGVSGVQVTADLTAALSSADVAVDFSSPQSTGRNLAACHAARTPLLIGTTGYPVEVDRQVEAAAVDIPILVAPNTSLGVTLLIELVRQAARALPETFDIEIIETHHRMKRDAPSGTALALGRAAAEGRGQAPGSRDPVVRRDGVPRGAGEIGFAVVRAGDIVGEHTVLFAGAGESLTLGHRATDRAIFARGALEAAAWLAARPVGRYFMRDLVAYKSGS
jgi:4-hydroxy-tetrahydrodipicolinate reductase